MKRPNGRKYSRDRRREEALKRQAERDKLAPKQQLEILDKRLGVFTGAIKERIRLMKLDVAENQNTRKKKNVKNSKA